jgi:4-amino-4-deoxy-L-arabinose transferase-like glycosyltransferase
MWGVVTSRVEQNRIAAVKSDRRDLYAQALVLVLAATAAALWVYTKPIVFTHDTFTYIHHARELQLKTALPGPMFSRTPGFPLILLAFRITDLSHSVFWLIVFHAILAVAMCWWFYLAARLVEPRGALLISLVFIASLLPFINIKYIMTEQTFLFATVLSLYGLIAYLTAETSPDTRRALIALGIGAAMMTLTRPQGAYVVPVLFGLVALLSWRRAKIALLAAVLVYAAILSVHTADQKIRSLSVSRWSAGEYSLPSGEWTEDRRAQGSVGG